MSTITAAIDLGTNSFRLLIASYSEGQALRVLAKETKTVRLGEGLEQSGRLQEGAIHRGVTALGHFKKLLTAFRPEKVRVCGTAALRNATNSNVFCLLTQQQLNTPLEIISAAEEAKLSLAGCQAALNRVNKPILLIDSGGGSTEIIYGAAPEEQGQAESCCFFRSIPVGAVNLTEKFLKEETAAPDIKLLTCFLTNIFQTELNTHLLRAGVHEKHYLMVASGGTATTLAALDLNLTSYDEEAVQGHIISKETLHNIIDKLHGIPLRQRQKLPALDSRRGEIILAGAMIYLTLMSQLNIEQLTVSDWGLLEGILLSTYSRNCSGTPHLRPFNA